MTPNQTPGLFVFPGNGPADAAPTNNSPLFDMHEPNLEVGVRMLGKLVVDYLRY